MTRDRKEYMRAYYEAHKATAKDRKEYMRAYYEANKEALKEKSRNRPRRTEAKRAAEARYQEKKRLLREIAEMPVPTMAV